MSTAEHTEMVVIDVHDERSEIEAVQSDLLARVDRQGYSKASHFAIKLAFEEAIVNAFEHGHEGLSKDLSVRVEYKVSPDEVRITIEDQGPGFDPASLPDPTLDENLTKPSGRGIMLIRAYMTEVNHRPPGNRMTMVYRKPDA